MKKHLLTLSAVLTALVCSTATFTSCGNDDDDDDNNNDSNPSQTVDKKENVIIYNNDTVYVNQDVTNATDAIKGYVEFVAIDTLGKELHRETFNQLMSEWSTCSIMFDPNYNPYEYHGPGFEPDHLKINIGSTKNPIVADTYLFGEGYYYGGNPNSVGESDNGYADFYLPTEFAKKYNPVVAWDYTSWEAINKVTKVEEIGTLKNGNKIIAVTGTIPNIEFFDHWDAYDDKLYGTLNYHLVGILR